MYPLSTISVIIDREGYFFLYSWYDMESMFDRLGDLLSNAIETNSFSLEERENSAQSQSSKDQTNAEENTHTDNTTVIQAVESFQEKKGTIKKQFYVPYHIKKDFELLGIKEFKTTEDRVKEAYKEMIKLFHPDRQKDIPILQKIAHEKTANIVDAYKRIQEWISSREVL